MPTRCCLNCRHALVPYINTAFPPKHIYCTETAELRHYTDNCTRWRPKRHQPAQLPLDLAGVRPLQLDPADQAALAGERERHRHYLRDVLNDTLCRPP